MLARLHQELAGYYNQDPRVEYKLNNYIFIAVEINVYNWIIWGAAGDRATEFDYVIPDNEEHRIL